MDASGVLAASKTLFPENFCDFCKIGSSSSGLDGKVGIIPAVGP